MNTTELLAHIFPDPDHPLAAQFAGWLATSSRFQAFAMTYRDKIRKKARQARDADASSDLGAELATAYWLVQPRGSSVEYEPLGLRQQRGPDFAVHIGSTRFTVEVTRFRAAALTANDAAATYKLSRTIADKLGQMPPNTVNMLLFMTAAPSPTVETIAAAIKLLKARTAQKDEAFFVQRGFGGTRDFYKYLLRLSAIVVREAAADGSAHTVATWINKEAKHALPSPVSALFRA